MAFSYGNDKPLSPYIYLQNSSASYIDYQINSGTFSPDFALQQPFRMDDVFSDSLGDEFQEYFKQRWNAFYGDGSISLQGDFSNDFCKIDKFQDLFALNFSAHYVSDHVILANRTVMTNEYKFDPHYPGDLSGSDYWIYGRTNDAYININVKEFDLFVGRMNKNWGPINSPGTLISDNPYTYDNVSFSYTKNRFKFTNIYSRLEDADGFSYSSDDTLIVDEGVSRKYISGHRLDLRLFDNLQVGLTEMAIYGGPNRDFELSYINPMSFYYGIQRNERKGISGLWAFDLFYKPQPKITLYTQILVDDIIVNNVPGQDDRARYPDRLGVVLSARTGDMFLQGLNLNLTYTKIWNQTYQSLRSWENYHYRGLGLGFPQPGIESIGLKAGYWALFPFFIENELIVGRYGSVTIEDMFFLNKEKFPARPVTHNLVNIFTVKYFINKRSKAYFSSEFYQDPNHYLNRMTEQVSFVFRLGFDYLFSVGMDL